MSNSAYIRDIASLDQLRIAIARFSEESENQLNLTDSKLQSRFDDLKSLESQFQRIIESAQNDLWNANILLAECESNTYENEEGETVHPNCDFEKEKVDECKKRLKIAEYNYISFQTEIRNLEKAIEEYLNPKIKFKRIIQDKNEAAVSSLKQLINGAEDYLSVTSSVMSREPGLMDAIYEISPLIIIEATAQIAETILISFFSFFSEGGSIYSLLNTKNDKIISSTFSENGKDCICSEMRIEKKGAGNLGKIISVSVPPSLQNKKVGKYFIRNMEMICRANDCKEISGWSSTTNLSFFQGLNYQSRNEVNGAGGEVFKPLGGKFLDSQMQAKAAFENLNNADFIKSKKLGKVKVNPLNIISPEEMNDKKFWGQHGENQARYVDLIEKYDQCLSEMQSGKTLDQIRTENMWIANAYDVFNGSGPIRLQKYGEFFRIDSNGRHRVAAAQLYYMQTGKNIFLTAEVFEKE